MMCDIFVEQLVKRKPTVATTALKSLIWIAVAVVTLPLCLTVATLLVAPIVLLISLLIAFPLLRQLNLEFEYALTNQELDVAIIMGQKKRKAMMSLFTNEIELMAPVCDDFAAQMQNPAIAITYNAVSADNAEGRWFVLFRHNGKLNRLFWEPNERMIEGIARFNPAAVQGHSPA